jgi:hypothetical protein
MVNWRGSGRKHSLCAGTEETHVSAAVEIPASYSLKMVAEFPPPQFLTSVNFYHTTRRHIPEDSPRRENLTSRILTVVCVLRDNLTSGTLTVVCVCRDNLTSGTLTVVCVRRDNLTHCTLRVTWDCEVAVELYLHRVMMQSGSLLTSCISPATWKSQQVSILCSNVNCVCRWREAFPQCSSRLNRTGWPPYCVGRSFSWRVTTEVNTCLYNEYKS